MPSPIATRCGSITGCTALHCTVLYCLPLLPDLATCAAPYSWQPKHNSASYATPRGKQLPPSLTSLHGSQLFAQRGSTLRFVRFIRLVPHAVLRGRGWGSAQLSRYVTAFVMDKAPSNRDTSHNGQPQLLNTALRASAARLQLRAHAPTVAVHVQQHHIQCSCVANQP